MSEIPHQSGANSQADLSSKVSAPAIALPKGGGAIRGMGEKFAANPVTGTGAMSIPIAASPGRSGFGPQPSLSYDSGSGNGPFGFGWSLSLPSITRKTDRGLPLYQDPVDSDVFLLSGVEDLVPVFKKDSTGDLVRDPQGQVTYNESQNSGYTVRRYCPRIEGLFARIERWTNQNDATDVFWRTISSDNITTWYGKSGDSRIVNPADQTMIFSWSICESHDDKGNVSSYIYAREDSSGVNASQAHEKNRTDLARSANHYLKRILYGNRTPYFPTSVSDAPPVGRDAWLFELVFDYGEHDPDLPQPDGVVPWTCRQDPLSSYRAGFEVRTYRLCQRVLMFHRFVELGNDPRLVRSTDFTYCSGQVPEDGFSPKYAFLSSVTPWGYQWESDHYRKQSTPPVDFVYTYPVINEQIQEVDAESLQNLPVGLDGKTYQWVDLDGEGIAGLLTEQANEWFYKPNLGEGRFGPLEKVTRKPSLAALNNGRQQLLDLAGDGRLDLVEFGGPNPGFFKRTQDQDWEEFRPFPSLPNIPWNDPNLRFVDLNGDGYADVLITEQEIFTWYSSLGEAGFDPAARVSQPADEERGPQLVFADSTQSVFLADMSGDGLTDLVRIRNGEICYWPNLGYGRFGARVTMDNSPWFDLADQFDQRRIRVADIDGSGTADVIYLGTEGVTLYFNQFGDGWSASRLLNQFPRVDDYSSIMTTDLLGNGTACLVWSSALPREARRPLQYIDLMGGQKPHLLVTVMNNLGAETQIQYVSSTKFYLADKAAGTPWVTRLLFPVHVVEKVTTVDHWRKSQFSTTYSYHHGYFDGYEREFRGFGRVEQVDIESFGQFAASNQGSPYITADQTLYQPPVKTVTWFHTGIAVDRERVLSNYAQEYFPHWFDATRFSNPFPENALSEPDLAALAVTPDEWVEAIRACKGMVLRQEVYELDVDALEQGRQEPVRLFTTAYHNCHIQMLQPCERNRHAVFLVTESEALTYHYELDLTQASLAPDPRITHTLNLDIDELGNIRQSVAVVYPRLGQFQADSLETEDLDRINVVQQEPHLVYTENRFTNDIDDVDVHRVRMPYEVLTYEFTGNALQSTFFTLKELQDYQLSSFYPTGTTAVEEILYQKCPDLTKIQKRLVEHTRTLFFNEDLSGPSTPLGSLSQLGLVYEQYRLALTDDLLNDILGDKLTQGGIPGSRTAQEIFETPAISGYLSGADLRFTPRNTSGEYWIRSGIAGFSANAQQHFYLPERYEDPFGNITTLSYDVNYDLFLQSSADPLGNTTSVTSFDYRLLAPCEIKDPNDNLTEARFDVLGKVIAMAVKGKGSEGDDLTGLDADLSNPAPNDLAAFFNSSPFDEAQARSWLQNATTRFVYSFGEVVDGTGQITWESQPAGACTIQREKHTAQLIAQEDSNLQVAFEYSDGLGAVLVKKVRAEAAAGQSDLRWIASGKTILNNKGKPVKQYEPYFSESAQQCEEPHEVGVTPILYYDAAGRLVRTEFPDGTLSRVEFSPWQVQSFDANDTVLESAWYEARKPGSSASTEEQRAADLAKDHAGTPAVTVLDSLGRDVFKIAHNRIADSSGQLQDKKYVTYTHLDAEGKPLWIQDARRNLVMRYTVAASSTSDPTVDFCPAYDIAGNLLFQHSMDAGERWMLNDAAGKLMLAWDANEFQDEDDTISLQQRLYFTEYDALHRPFRNWLSMDGDPAKLVEYLVYGEDATAPPDPQVNMRGQIYRHYDPGGLTGNTRFDFKGNLLEQMRRLASDAKTDVLDWQANQAATAWDAGLEGETFVHINEYDALNRMTRQYNWHQGPGSRVAVYEPQYNPRGLLTSEELVVRASKTANGYDPVASSAGVIGSQNAQAIQEIHYDAKGQKEFLKLGNGTLTRYDYDPQTFHLRQLRTSRPNYDPSFPKHSAGLNDDQILQQLYYTYDPVGNITEIYDEAYEPVFFQNQQVDAHSIYEYNAIYRLIGASGRENGVANGVPAQFEDAPIPSNFPLAAGALHNYTEAYQYDEVGNFIQMRHSAGPNGSWTRNYETAADSNRLLHTWDGTDRASALITNYSYDTHGNMLNLANVAVSDQMRWDTRDMIHSLNLLEGGWAYYTYDSGKQRTRKRLERSGGTVEERIYLGGYERYRKFDAQKKLVEEIETLHLLERDQRALLVDDIIQTDKPAMAIGPLYRYQYSNHLGSACLELDEASEIITYEEYHPYGTSSYQAVRNQTVTPKRYRYTGKERDEESGLYYHGARYYGSWLGRWCSPDPSPKSRIGNPYEYVRQNPIKFLDPNGMAERPSLLDQIATSAAAAVLLGLRSGLSVSFGNPPTEANQDQAEVVRLIEKGDYSRSLEVASGFGEYFAIHTEANKIDSPGLEQATLMLGHLTGFNQGAEAWKGETRQGTKLDLFERVGKGIDATGRLINTSMAVASATAAIKNYSVTSVIPKLTQLPPSVELPKNSGFKVVSPTLVSGIRSFLVVKLPSGIKRIMYKSSGHNSGQARIGVWQPTLGELAERHIIKIGEDLPEPLWRFGSEEALEASRLLGELNLPQGGIPIDNGFQLNQTLARYGGELEPTLKSILDKSILERKGLVPFLFLWQPTSDKQQPAH
jgi:RHS repeat-associated protein